MPVAPLTDLRAIPARHLPSRIAAGDTTAETVTAAYLDHIAAVEPNIGAWVHLAPGQAIAEARLRDRAATGLMRGVPVAVKDVFDTHDLPTAYGSAVYPADNQPPRDAAAVALIRAAGAVMLGKTVTTEFAGFDPGPTQHPRRPGTTPGGSSSGSAAAVASGMAPLAFGTQTSGSIIRPAAFCGVAGFKPTFGLLDRTGVKALADSLDTLGLLARDVRDLAFFAAVLRDDPGWAVADGPQSPPRLAVFRTPVWHRAEPASQQRSRPRPRRRRRPGPRWWSSTTPMTSKRCCQRMMRSCAGRCRSPSPTSVSPISTGCARRHATPCSQRRPPPPRNIWRR